MSSNTITKTNNSHYHQQTMNTLYEHAEERMPPRAAYDPAMDHPEPKPKRKPMPIEVHRIVEGAKSYRMESGTILTSSRPWFKYAVVVLPNVEPYLTVERRDVAKLMRHYRKEAGC
jgi:hypothetical protein